MIEKPPGEAGRPGRGGYNLEKTLGWDSKTLAAEYVHSCCDERLEIATSYNNQAAVKKQAVMIEASTRFPNIFSRYRDGWPINDLIIAHLKYTSGQARKAIRERRGGRN
ncbi:hypothetical protein EYR40_002538 [Pleurotus pulmonarius]|nr:hypothetical protein EYR40_002538 [Pleurotus pulmonarius]